ncbi:MAG: hypothetical protein K0R47_2211 [Brevibacillus sp.]|nr:hypothetical protein [Brevibacillus sp.]
MAAQAIGTLFLDLVPAVAVLDEDKRILWFGGKTYDFCNLGEGERFTDLLPPDKRPLSDEQILITTHSNKKILLRFKPFAMTERSYLIVLMEEISDPLSNKDARLACLEAIVNSLDEGVMMSDSEGRITLYNKAQEKLEGLRQEKVVGNYLWEAYNYNPELSEHRRVFQSGTPIIGQYRAHSHINGIPQYVTYSTYPIEQDGQIIAVFSVSTNETKLKDLLYETIELKRKMLASDKVHREFHGNGTTYTFDHIKGNSSVLTNLVSEAQNVAVHNTDLLIVGETGTGKELFAQSIHNHSKRAKSPFVAVNCAAIPETLLESTLFGSVKGAFTGATDQTGLFEYAQDGTLFLDEINSMPLSLQSKLIRVLEERVVRRLGAAKVTPVRCVVISASNEDPHELIARHKLRMDLYYRIARTCLIIPPLRERKDDILFLLHHFINRFSKATNKQIHGLSDTLMEILLDYKWPGNIRELQHVVENLIIRASDDQRLLDVANLPVYLRQTIINEKTALPAKPTGMKRAIKSATSSYEREYIRSQLEASDWNITQAAKCMGLTRQSLQYHIKKLKLRQ